MNDRPAFPTNESAELSVVPGMTLREYYAGLAMQACLARTTCYIEDAPRDIAEEACDYADALIAALAKEKA